MIKAISTYPREDNHENSGERQMERKEYIEKGNGVLIQKIIQIRLYEKEL